MKHYNLDDGFGGDFTISNDPENELISLTVGWHGLVKGYYAQISRSDLCIVDFGATKRSALRHARKSWRKKWLKTAAVEQGYPRVIQCP